LSAAEQDEDEPDTVDIEEDTEDVVGEDELKKSGDPTEPGGGKTPRRIRMPSKMEIAKAVESVRTESIDVDEVIREAAKIPKTEDLE
jgi:hypothetical protein